MTELLAAVYYRAAFQIWMEDETTLDDAGVRWQFMHSYFGPREQAFARASNPAKAARIAGRIARHKREG